MTTCQFEVKQFASGEYEVKLINRINGSHAVIKWNWFNPSERDLMLLLMKINAVKRQYGKNLWIYIEAHYLPYARQDRMFEVGQDIAFETLISQIVCLDNVRIFTEGLHCGGNQDFERIRNKKYKIKDELLKLCTLVFPDNNASSHFNHNIMYMKTISFEKCRTSNGIELQFQLHDNVNYNNNFLICDDICAGGRTFIECAKLLREKFGNEITIRLMVYHAFLDYGIDKLKDAGISKIMIINPDSYEYICNLYQNDKDYFEFLEWN